LQNYKPEKDKIWICEDNGKIIGSIFLVDHKRDAQLRFFLVDKKYRGRGIGNKLMQLFMDEIYTSGYESCFLWTVNLLSSAASLYKKHGFQLKKEFVSNRFGITLKEQKYEMKLKRPNLNQTGTALS